MLYNLYDKEINKSIINRILALQPQTQAHWGRMNVVQMLKHCTVGLKVAFGEIKLKKTFIGIVFGRAAKKMLLKPASFKKNLPTDKHFIVTSEGDFEKAKQELISYVEKFITLGELALTNEPHPFFGKLKPEEWGILHYKHLDHHLRQFGA